MYLIITIVVYCSLNPRVGLQPSRNVPPLRLERNASSTLSHKRSQFINSVLKGFDPGNTATGEDGEQGDAPKVGDPLKALRTLSTYSSMPDWLAWLIWDWRTRCFHYCPIRKSHRDTLACNNPHHWGNLPALQIDQMGQVGRNHCQHRGSDLCSVGTCQSSGIMDHLGLFGSGAATWIARALLSEIGFDGLATLMAAFVFHLPHRTCLTIGLKVGIQNTMRDVFAQWSTHISHHSMPPMGRCLKKKNQQADPNNNETNWQNNEESTTTRHSDDGHNGPVDNTVDRIPSLENGDSIPLPDNGDSIPSPV